MASNEKAHQQGKIIIKIHKTVQFEIVAFEHDIDSQSYIDKVERFCQGSATAEGLLDDLNIPLRPDTQFATGAHTPGEGPIYLREMIGQGGFGVVTYYWDVSTGHEIVVKRPRDDMVRMFLRKGVNSAKTEAALADARGKWRREANNMKNLIHVSILLRSWRHGSNLNSLILYGCCVSSTIHTPNWSWNISREVPWCGDV